MTLPGTRRSLLPPRGRRSPSPPTLSRRTSSTALCLFFFFNDSATTEIYTLSLHDALPISMGVWPVDEGRNRHPPKCHRDRKSTRLNSSHGYISYAVFCLKKKKKRSAHQRGGSEKRSCRRGSSSGHAGGVRPRRRLCGGART